jgi:hypothetical protein
MNMSESKQASKPVMSEPLGWSTDSICLHLDTFTVGPVAEAIYKLTCRTDFSAPGFAVVTVGGSVRARSFRQLMIDLKEALALVHASRASGTLVFHSLLRFDQQHSTKPHLDGGPDQCFLMLGYEPTTVESEVEISDYSKCAFELGITPKAFMTKYNPVFQADSTLLQAYTVPVPCFSRSDYRILFINNSCAEFSLDRPAWQGVLHTATVRARMKGERRIINSALIGAAPAGSSDLLSRSSQESFIDTPMKDGSP